MFDNVGRSVVMLGGAAGLTFCLAGGVAVGVVPQIGGTSTRSVVAAQPLAAAQDAPAAPVTEDTVAPPAEAPPEEAAPVDTTVARSGGGVSREVAVAEAAEEEVAEAAAEAGAPAGPTTSARVSPSSAQVQAAIASIGAGLPISEAQARQFGNTVCDAFDSGQSFSEVKAAALREAKKVPFVSVTAAQVDAAVRSAVQLFCPGYSSQI